MTRNLKKAASLILAAAMLISCFAFSGSAAGTVSGDEAMSIGLALSAETAKPGDTVTVTVSISNNYHAAAMRIPVLYSKDFFEVVGEDGGITTPIDSVTATQGNTKTVTLDDWIPDAYSADTYSAFTIQWTGTPVAGVGLGLFNSTTAAECFTFQLKVLDTASGTGSVFIPEEADFLTLSYSDPDDYTSDIKPDVIFTLSDPATVVVEKAGPTLVAADGYSVRTIKFDGDDNTYLCGFNVNEIIGGGDFTEQFVVENGTYTVSSDTFATGTVVTLYDSEGNKAEEYTIIYFGDTNGDGMIDTTDVTTVIMINAEELNAQGTLELYAADVAIENELSVSIDTSDIAMMIKLANYELLSDDINQDHTV